MDMAGKGRPKTGGRTAGTPNKANHEARVAIAALVDGNMNKLQSWLNQVADGIPKLDEAGRPLPGEYVTLPDPAKAFALFTNLIEFSVPKLARTEVTGKDGGPIASESRGATSREFADGVAARMLDRINAIRSKPE